MAGQHQDRSADGTHVVTIGSADDYKLPDATAFVSQQDDQGHKLTVVYDAQHRIISESERPRP